MKWLSVVVALLLALTGVRAEGPDDQYVLIYNLIQEADLLNNNGQPRPALTKYLEAQAGLQKFQKGYPDWNTKVVAFRLNYLAGRIAVLSASLPPPATGLPSETVPSATPPAQPGVAVPAQPTRPAPPSDWEQQVTGLKDQVRQMQTDKGVLEAKLKEALSARPAAVDPRELARAEERIKGLQKENELLQAGLAQEKTKPAPAPDSKALDEARLALVQANRQIAEQDRKIDALAREKTQLQNQRANLAPTPSNAAALEEARKALKQAELKIDEQTKLAINLTQEKAALQSRLRSLTASVEADSALRAENQLLKKQLADLKAASTSSVKSKDAGRQLALARAQIAALESDKEMLRLEKASLEKRVKQLSVAVAAPAASAVASKPEDSGRIRKLQQERDDLRTQLDSANKELKGRNTELARARTAETQYQTATTRDAATIKGLQQDRDSLRKQLDVAAKELADRRTKPSSTQTAAVENQSARAQDAARLAKMQQERDDLRKQLDAANKELKDRKGKVAASRMVEMESQVAALRAKVDVFEARRAPYTAEELALFRKPEPRLAASETKTAAKATPRAPAKEMSPGSVAMVAEAQRYFSARQFDKAEEKYLQVLRQNQDSVSTLANFAAVELELNHLDVAETNINQALALAPDNAYSLLVLGRLRYRQTDYDGALDALSRAAKSEPQSAEIQNFLGLTLSQKGLRGPAEAALRKAIQLEPGYGDAHNNLAVIYLAQQPPLLELARWHYQKALQAGCPHNSNLERMLEARKE